MILIIIHSFEHTLLVLRKGKRTSVYFFTMSLRPAKNGVSDRRSRPKQNKMNEEVSLIGDHDEYHQVGIPLSYIKATRCCASIALILALLTIVGLVVFYVLVGTDTVENTDMIADLKASVLQLQICKNGTKDGVSVHSDSINIQGGGCPVGAPFSNCRKPGSPCMATACVQDFDTELWDDANFWNPGTPNRVFIPRDGRYAIGVQCSIFTTSVDKVTIFAGLVDDVPSPTGILLCKTANINPPLFTSNSVYCEAEIQKQAANSIVVTLKSEAGTPVSSRCTLSVRQLGPLTGIGYGFP